MGAADAQHLPGLCPMLSVACLEMLCGEHRNAVPCKIMLAEKHDS